MESGWYFAEVDRKKPLGLVRLEGRRSLGKIRRVLVGHSSSFSSAFAGTVLPGPTKGAGWLPAPPPVPPVEVSAMIQAAPDLREPSFCSRAQIGRAHV